MLPYISIFITILLFSTIEVFSKMISGSVDPLFLSFLRFFFSGVILILLDIKKISRIEKRDWIYFTLLGLLGITVAFGSYHLSLINLDASTAAVIFSMNPVFSSLFAFIFLKESFGRNKVIGLVIGFIGVYILLFGFKPMNLSHISNVILMLVAAIGFGTYIAWSKPFIRKYGSFVTTGFVFVIGSLPYLLFIDNFSIGELDKTLPVLLYLTFLATGLAYVLYFYGLKRVPIIVGTSMFYIKPVLATIFAIILLGESPAINFYIGVFIILSGMLLTLRTSKAP